MTKSVTIVNTSNWDGEKVDVILQNRQFQLKPGEQRQVMLPTKGATAVKVLTSDEKNIRPFVTDGVQEHPVVETKFEPITEQ